MPDPNSPQPADQDKAPSRVTRRGFGVLGGAVLVGGILFGANWFNITARAEGDGLISVAEAHAQANAGHITLVDIRRPDEWQRTGLGEGAHPIDMRRPDFVEALLSIAPDRSAPVALICARGVRSRAMTNRLTEAGFTNIIDVPEGMLGSGAGPGWLRSGLPVVQYSGN